MRIAFKTFGCKANSLDTDSLYQEALRRHYTIVPESDMADVYIINSCTVTERADKEARMTAHKYKLRNPAAKIGLLGCYAQVADKEIEKLSSVDFIIGSGDKNKIFSLLEHTLTPQKKNHVSPPTGYLPEFHGSRHQRAFIKIQDGCNFNCSFCIIPKARGRSKSLSFHTVAHQIEKAYRLGYQEVVLTGIHLAHYGWDHKEGDLEMLLLFLLEKKDGPRIRLSTLDPFEIGDPLIELLGSHKQLCPSIHIALQSGSDEILKSMRRIYRASSFIDVTTKMKKQKRPIYIGVDVIVGYPGESEEDFNKTLTLLQSTYWTKLHVFPYSDRSGTTSSRLENKIPFSIIKQRARTLLSLSDTRLTQFLESQVERKINKNVILEKESKILKNFWQGHAEDYTPTLVYFSDKKIPTSLVKKIITFAPEKVFHNRLLLHNHFEQQ